MTITKRYSLPLGCCLVIAIAYSIANAYRVRTASASSQNETSRTENPKWEVVSVKPCESSGPDVVGGRGGGPAGGGSWSPGRLTLNCQFVIGLISAAYVMNADGRVQNLLAATQIPIEGGPSWVRTDRYTINAKAEGTPDRPMMAGPMLQAVLEDRFKLKLRHVTRDVPVYSLTVAKGGHKLQPFKEGSCTPTVTTNFPAAPLPPGAKRCRNLSTISGAVWTFDQEAINLEAFKSFISFGLDRPVVNNTGLSGLFDFHFTYANPILGTGSADTPAGAPSIFTAVEQFGLKLEATRGPAQSLVIDTIERPAEN
jgi:uncharacterized protein (TIGR03435 family)